MRQNMYGKKHACFGFTYVHTGVGMHRNLDLPLFAFVKGHLLPVQNKESGFLLEEEKAFEPWKSRRSCRCCRI